MTDASYDVIIPGGGLAGQTLARQLVRARPSLRIAVIEKHAFPVPEAAFKVGESTVEIGAHYYRDILDLKPHLESAQLPKLGLRYFFPAGDNRAITPRVEVGGTFFPVVGSHQLDRGRFENFLAAENAALGVDVLDGWAVKDVNLPARAVTCARDGETRTLRGRWIADASGRTGFIRRQLALGHPVTHDTNASWWRYSKRLAIDDWSADSAWMNRVASGERWLSTNHLMGRGYWVWFIPLGSGSTSVGIVADAKLHPFSRISRFEPALDWLREFEPQAAEVCEAHRHLLQDFRALRRYAYGCSQVYSADRWALTGEAGLFTDPFYSPGSDFIAMGNTFITDLVLRDLDGEDISTRVGRFNHTYLQLFEAFLQIFDGQYPLMGNAQVMTAKIVWDNSTYWAVSALLFFNRKYIDLAFMERISPLFRRFLLIHRRMQAFLRQWDEAERREWRDAHVNLLGIRFMYDLQAGLAATHTDETLAATLDQNMLRLEGLASAIEALAPRGLNAGRRGMFASDSPYRDEILGQLEAIRLERVANGVEARTA
jgi:flavin-dependent dehydrogenase